MKLFSKTPEYLIKKSSHGDTMPSMHYHSTYEIYYLDAGGREYFVEDKFFLVKAGDFVLIPKQMMHRTGGAYGVRILISFSEEFLKKTFTEKAIKSMLECFKNTLITPEEEKSVLFKQLLTKLSDSSNSTEFAINLGVLLNELSKCEDKTNYESQISTIVSYINSNYADIRNIEQISDEFYISKYYLCHLFKKSIGITVIEYLNRIKIKNACNMMQSTDMSLTEISQVCGFNSSSYFSKVFKEIMGKSPLEYKSFQKVEETH